jgi:hypothetical protein
MDLEDHQAATVDKLFQATFGLWNALLTVNGIVLTVFSALYAIAPQSGGDTVRVLIGASVVSCCLLVFNHLAMKATYHRMGEVITGSEVTQKERERDLRHALWRHRALRISETACLALFLIEVALIAVFTYTLPGR